MEKISFVGLEEFDELEKAVIKSIAEKNYDKVNRESSGVSIFLHSKKYQQDGTRNKFVITGKVESGGNLVAHAEADSWKLEKAVHMLMEKLVNGVQKKFKTKGR